MKYKGSYKGGHRRGWKGGFRNSMVSENADKQPPLITNEMSHRREKVGVEMKSPKIDPKLTGSSGRLKFAKNRPSEEETSIFLNRVSKTLMVINKVIFK